MPPFGSYEGRRASIEAPITWKEYQSAWRHYSGHWEAAAARCENGVYPAERVRDVILDDTESSLKVHLQQVMDLWGGRWLLESYMAGQVLASVETEHGIAQDANRLDQLVEEVGEELRVAKDESESLDNWFDALHQLSPHIHHGMALAHHLENNTMQRFFDELSADTGTVLGNLAPRYLRGSAFSSEHLLPERRGVVPTKKELRYKLNARVYFPRFWFERAVEWLENHSATIPSELDQYGAVSALWLAFSQSFDGATMTLSWELPFGTNER
jgi:hypothetical protein